MMKPFALLLLFSVVFNVTARPPNIVYIMSDELAYYEVGYMGNELLHTPRIDRMAKEGMMFTQARAAAPVCGPLRGSLMTGKHQGHASVRANDGGTPLRADEETIASVLKPLGYATGGFGKWGAGGRGSTGVPEKHGFDVFFGYYDQVHAHTFYPPYLIRNSEEVPLKGNVGGRSGETYSHYEIMKEGLQFIRDNKDQPFFCYFPITPPHGMYDIPATDPALKLYADKNDWPGEAKNYAAMVTMIDRDLGDVLDLLKELKLEDNTIVFFTGDNGGQDRFRTKEHPRGFFGPNKHPKTGAEFRGGKGNLYEGGLRIPALARWPGKIKAGAVSDHVWSQQDVFPTLAELTGANTPGDVDGLSFLPTLLNKGEQQRHEMLYWEYGGQTAVLMQDWKAIRPKMKGPWALYDLSKDGAETTNIAAQHPEIVKKMVAFAEASHEPWKAGTYTSRTEHERDRWAKWGSSKPQPSSSGQNPVEWSKKGLLRKATISIKSFSSESSHNQKVARAAIDGDPRTWWHSDWAAKHPHELVLDLGDEFLVKGVRYLARQDNAWNGAVAKADLAVSRNGMTWSEPVTHTFKKNRKPQEILIPESTARYLRFRVLSEVGGQRYASIAELGVIGK